MNINEIINEIINVQLMLSFQIAVYQKTYTLSNGLAINNRKFAL